MSAYSRALRAREEVARARREFAPPVLISREAGGGGRRLAKALAERLGFELCDRRILEEIAAKSKVPPDLVELLDEHPRGFLEVFGTGLLRGASISLEEFDRYLRQAVTSFLKLGRVVILGRGAAFLAEPGTALRLRLVAPFETRVQNFARMEGITEKQAREKIPMLEAERERFLNRVFGKHRFDDEHFDLTINTGTIPLDAAIKLALETYEVVCGEHVNA